MASKLTDLQQKFLKNLFGAALGDTTLACEMTGIADYQDLMTDDLIEEIRTRADQNLSMNVPKAVFLIQKMLANSEDGSMFVSEKLHKVATDLLDRVGLSKKERPNSGGTTLGLVFLPAKASLPLPPPDDVITIEHRVLESVV